MTSNASETVSGRLDSQPNSRELLASLQTRANTLLDTLRAYQTYLRDHDKQRDVEIRAFRRGVESEVKSLDTITKRHTNQAEQRSPDEDDDEEAEGKRLHVLRSSNLPFYEAVWRTARRCKGIVSLGKRMYWQPDVKPGQSRSVTSPGNRRGKKGVIVDIISDNGLTWTKVSTVTAKRLLFEMAKEGWERYGGDSDDESSNFDDENDTFDETASKLEIVRQAEDLKAAARASRVQFQHPRICFVLPNIQEQLYDDVDAILADLRATGAIVQVAKHGTLGVNGHAVDAITSKLGEIALSKDDFAPLMPFSTREMTSTINIDCTLLLALISDISHYPRNQLPPSPNMHTGTYHTAIIRQIESEEKQHLLPYEIYPCLSNRELRCTDQAAERMMEIVETMGTTKERARADILLGQGEHKDKSAAELRDALEQISTHKVPVDMSFRVKVVAFEDDKARTDLNEYSRSVAQRAATAMRLSPINRSVFLYGWFEGITTLTSNRVVAAGLERTINEILDRDEDDEAVAGNKADGATFAGPNIHISETARSLVGKDKHRREG